MQIFINGLMTGLFLQLAIGPVFFFIINLSFQKTIFDGFAASFAVTLADYFYITLALVGVGKMLEKSKIKRLFGIISSIVLIIFGFSLIKGIANVNFVTSSNIASTSILSSFTYTFLLTITSPLTIVLFTSIFATKAIEFNYTKKQLYPFGFGTGLATFLFMGTSVLIFSLLKETIPIILIQILNLLVGCLLIGYGGIRLFKTLKR